MFPPAAPCRVSRSVRGDVGAADGPGLRVSVGAGRGQPAEAQHSRRPPEGRQRWYVTLQGLSPYVHTGMKLRVI